MSVSKGRRRVKHSDDYNTFYKSNYLTPADLCSLRTRCSINDWQVKAALYGNY